MGSRITTSFDTTIETLIRRYYIPLPVVTLGDIFSRMTDRVQGNKTTLCPKPLRALLRYYEIQDAAAGGYFHDIPPKLWRGNWSLSFLRNIRIVSLGWTPKGLCTSLRTRSFLWRR